MYRLEKYITYCIINIQLGDSNKLPTSTTSPPSAELAFGQTETPHLVDEGESRNTTAHIRNRYCKRCGLFCTTGSTVDQDMCPLFQWKPGDGVSPTGDGFHHIPRCPTNRTYRESQKVPII